MKTTIQTELTAWLCLDGVPGLGPKRAQRLLAQAPPEQLCQLSVLELQRLGLTALQAKALITPDWSRLEPVLNWVEQPDHCILPWSHPRYPGLLREIAAAPLLLFCQGNPDCLSLPQIAMVGTRQPSPGGLAVAAMFAEGLVQQGLAITSGLALGIDAACHRAALQAQGTTLAVLATGLHHCYPRSHRQLAEEIVATGGLLVSEFWPDVLPRAEYFPRRNRIISGLAQGTLVVEAAVRSGSLITARYALEQGREVFAIPGSILNPEAEGCLQLIQQGAKLVLTVEDVLDEIRPQMGTTTHFSDNLVTQPGLPLGTLLDNVGYEPTTIDFLVQQTGLSADKVMTELLELELDGWIASVAGGYVRARRGG